MTAESNARTTAHNERRAAGVAFGAHALHDGYTDLIYVMLPVWQAEFGIGYAALGLMKTAFSGALAGLQIPSERLAKRYGAPVVLSLGTALAGIGYMLAGASQSFMILVMALLIGGLGASTQHPIASAMISRAFVGKRSMKALGAYNFFGDVGKMTVPAAASVLLLVLPWREALVLLGSFGLLAAVAIYVFIPRFPVNAAANDNAPKLPGASRATLFGFPLLLSIGVIDSATRMAVLTFLPFVLTAKGASLPVVGIALTLVFAGGAAGKLVCAFIGARIGTIATVWLTEAVTAVAILALTPLPLDATMLLLPLLGVALNGTSSVLYGSVPDLVEPSQHGRAFGIFYTGTIGAGAVSPALYGLLGDAVGVPTALMTIAGIVLVTLPLSLALRPALSAAQPS